MPVGVFPHPKLADYSLLDSGDGEKLERFGSVVLRRPDPQALWRRRFTEADWSRPDLRFVRESDRGGRWEGPPGAPVRDEWTISIGRARMLVRPTPFKHVGVFPEQSANWDWVEQRRRGFVAAGADKPALLNLFAYTGAATVLAARAGWSVTHVDASKSSLDWANANARHNELPEDAVRWICDDAAAFAAREVRRGNRYQGVLLDPPHYGRGPKGEKWQFEDGIAPLLESCRQLLDEAGAFLVLSTYAIGYSPLAFENMLAEFGPGELESGELALPEEVDGRLLPCGYCARWWRDPA